MIAILKIKVTKYDFNLYYESGPNMIAMSTIVLESRGYDSWTKIEAVIVTGNLGILGIRELYLIFRHFGRFLQHL